MGLYDVFFDLTRLEIHLWDQVDEALRAEINIPLGRFEAMLVMRRLGPCRIQDVSRELSVTVGGTSKLVDRLEESGFCARTPHPDDRRSSLISLTGDAQGVLDRGNVVLESILQSTLTAHLADDEIRTLRKHLRKLRRDGNAPAML
jgi:DNA-binding MarR family transcriptional regulator